MTYTIDQLSNMVDALTARLAALDGQGLGAGIQGTVPQLQGLVSGQRTAMLQLTTTLQSQLVTLKATFTALVAPLRQALGLPALS